MATYNYSEAPAFVENEVHANPANFGSAGSVASFDTAEELGDDREMLQEAYAWQHRGLNVQDTTDMHRTAALPPVAFPQTSLSTCPEIIYPLVALSQIGAGTSTEAAKIGKAGAPSFGLLSKHALLWF
ncbi:uncharacterized protein [Miscanthus floridulus]|uniref:uncharacterized protein n=1 Tax=Miscanthus floridulus TaxID=154761 RepID=UPI00345A84CA